MNKTQLEGRWETLKGQTRQVWGKLTDDDVEQVQGNLEELKGRIKARYGYESDRINEEIERFLSGTRDDIRTS